MANVRLFNAELRQYGNDLNAWRLYKARAPCGGHGGPHPRARIRAHTTMRAFVRACKCVVCACSALPASFGAAVLLMCITRISADVHHAHQR